MTPQAEQQALRENGDDTLVTKPLTLRSLDRQVIEHKDVNKALAQLVPVVSSLKVDPGDILEGLSQFSALWNQVLRKKRFGDLSDLLYLLIFLKVYFANFSVLFPSFIVLKRIKHTTCVNYKTCLEYVRVIFYPKKKK